MYVCMSYRQTDNWVDQDYEEMDIPYFVINKGEAADWHQVFIDHILELEETSDLFD